MNTLFLVMAKYQAEDIPLEKLCEEHFGMTLGVANRRAGAHQLPVPFYKKAGKSGFFCSAQEWAAYLDKQADKAKQEWHRVNEPEVV